MSCPLFSLSMANIYLRSFAGKLEWNTFSIQKGEIHTTPEVCLHRLKLNTYLRHCWDVLETHWHFPFPLLTRHYCRYWNVETLCLIWCISKYFPKFLLRPHGLQCVEHTINYLVGSGVVQVFFLQRIWCHSSDFEHWGGNFQAENI